MWERDTRDTEVLPPLRINSRFPMLIGFEASSINRFSQLRGNFSTRPPNFVNNTDESLRERHAISRARCLCPGLRTVASWPLACAWRKSSWVLTHWIPAVFRHKYTRKKSAGDETRTRDVHLGKVVLYQLSYTRSFKREQ